ncbi:KilA N-terminal domain, N1R/P28 DNA binding [Acanthamoeba polyphaga mimivirus]|nr:KilA N-terminal domain, N1R/P28 DNA binding [Acanthamoeba polyphaga mimivirus]
MKLNHVIYIHSYKSVSKNTLNQSLIMPHKAPKSKLFRTRYVEDSDDETRGRSRNRSVEKSRSKSLTRSKSKSPKKSRSKSLDRSKNVKTTKSKNTNKSNKYTEEDSEDSEDSESDQDDDKSDNEQSDSELDDSESDDDETDDNESDNDKSKDNFENIIESKENDFRNIIFENINEKFAIGKFGDFEVIINRDNGYINATQLCKDCGKDYKNWNQNEKSREFVKKLSQYTGLSNTNLLTKIIGGNNVKLRGTYVHPIILTNIGNWISPTFAIKIGEWIEEWKKFSRKNTLKYYKELSKIELYSNNDKEKQIQLALQKSLGGKIEVRTKHGYVDLLTKDKIIEIKSYDNWKHALGQILAYGELYENKNKCIYLFDIPSKNEIANIKIILKKFGISLLCI